MPVNSGVKGKVAERAVADYLTRQGIPARREVRTGDRNTHDEGDINLGRFVCIEIKNWSGDLTIGSVVTLLAKLQRQKRDPGALGLLVDRLDRVADPGQWRVWMTAHDLGTLLSNVASPAWPGTLSPGPEPVACRLAAVVGWLKACGWVETTSPFAS
jgi:hypothetical protein